MALRAAEHDRRLPAGRPLLGTACTQAGLFCDYGCEQGVSRKCDGGVWVAASSPGGCPVSTRAAKRDIQYLDDAERAELAEDAMALKLTTWRYQAPLDDGRTHVTSSRTPPPPPPRT